MFHYAFMGHFEHAEQGIRFVKESPEAAPKPVLQRPLDVYSIGLLLHEFGLTQFPEEWGVSEADGYLICDIYTHSREAISYVTRLAQTAQCEIFDYSSLAFVQPEDYRYRWGQTENRTSRAAAG